MLVCKFTYLNACTSKLMFVCCCNEREREINVVPMLLHVSEREREVYTRHWMSASCCCDKRCVCVRVWVREREWEGERERHRYAGVMFLSLWTRIFRENIFRLDHLSTQAHPSAERLPHFVFDISIIFSINWSSGTTPTKLETFLAGNQNFPEIKKLFWCLNVHRIAKRCYFSS